MNFFRGFGKIRDVILKSGFGFVEFDDTRDAADAVEELNGRDLCGERVKIELSRRNGRDDRGGDRRRFDDRGGFGFVEFDDTRDAADAVEELNGRDLCGERVKIELSRRNGRDDRGGDRRRFDDRGGRSNKREKYGPPVQTRYRLLVDNLSTRCSWQVNKL
uniref:RRM domain-containing protein n=1 Tax=Panagrolaimus sp. PS1159 TaxID=55785 RepID=A0AC35GH86_9BILA